MNIFRLDADPEKTAQYLEDGHINSQLHEASLMMSAALRLNGHNDDYLYGVTHKNHPSTVWVREARDNFTWMYDLCEALYEEKCLRWGPGHDSWQETVALMPREPECLPDGGTVQAVVGTADAYVSGSEPQSTDEVVRAYRQAYFDSDRSYDLGRERPEWAPRMEVPADD